MCEISYMENYLIKMIILYTSQSNLCMKKSMILFTFMNIEKEYRYEFFLFSYGSILTELPNHSNKVIRQN